MLYLGIVDAGHTDTIDRNINMRAEDLVPAIYLCNEPSRPWTAACPTERVGEGSCGREVGLDRTLLGCWRRCAQSSDDVWDFCHC